jgi:hypothetical protein
LLHELTHRTKAGLRSVVSLALLLAFVLCSMPSAFAQTTTGNIQGTVSASQANTKLAGVSVTAVSPTGRYLATTDNSGFYSMNGVSPDTYTVTFKTNGYETITLTGVTVVQGSAANVSTTLNKTLQNIGRTQARSQSGAFQPAQTTDQYNVGAPQIATTLGKTGSTNEGNLLASIPGASFDSSGYPVLRGGREYEEGFQFEGIDYTDAFTHQFVNSLILNGAANFQERAMHRSETPEPARSTSSRSAVPTRTSASSRATFVQDAISMSCTANSAGPAPTAATPTTLRRSDRATRTTTVARVKMRS